MVSIQSVYKLIFLFVATVNSLLSGNPLDDINVNSIAGSYNDIFTTSRNVTDIVSNL